MTHTQYPKSELTRVVKTSDNEVVIDVTGKLNGRGAYLKLSHDNIARAIKTRALNKALGTDISSEIYAELERLLNEIEE